MAAAQQPLTVASKRLPDFIGIGPAHAGTTWLHWVLMPYAGLPLPKKETHFFDWHYEKGVDWYAERFAHCRGDQPIGEICNYFPSRIACERIATQIPDCKIICTLRDPVERAYSAYKFAMYNGLTNDSFEDALRTAPVITAENHYARHLGDWYDRFGRSRVLVLLFEDLSGNPQGYIDRVCEFIGLPRIDVASLELPARAYNAHALKPRHAGWARKGRRAMNWLQDRNLQQLSNFLGLIGIWRLCFEGQFPPIDQQVASRLRSGYLPEIEALERLSGLDLSRWKA